MPLVMLSAAKHPGSYFHANTGILRCAQDDIGAQTYEGHFSYTTARRSSGFGHA